MDVRTVVDNAWLTVVARVAIFFASFIALPIAGWMMVRAATSIDTVIDLTHKLEIHLVEMDGRAKLADEEISSVKGELQDHESRLRKIEAEHR